MSKKHERIIGAKVWALRGKRFGSLYFDENDLLVVGRTRRALIKAGANPDHIARVDIVEPRKKR